MALSVFIVFVVATCVSSQSVSTANSGNDLWRCDELTDLRELSLCLSQTVSRATKSESPSSVGGYGYPHRIAPTLPPFLIGSSNGLEANDAKRRFDSSGSSEAKFVKKIQIYGEPGYRNFLDLDATVSQRVVEYRPIYGDFPVPVVVHSVHPHQPSPAAPAYSNGGRNTNYYYNSKPVKRRGGPKKAYGGYHKNGRYPSKEYNTVEPQKDYYHNGRQKYEKEYQNHKNTGYDPEYFVPANSPITGDIRRSLLDYTGARDLMADEEDYLSGRGPTRQYRIKEIRSQYYPFRRSDVSVGKDLQADESKKPAQEQS